MTDQERRQSHWEWLQHRKRKRLDTEAERRGVDFRLGHELLSADEYDALAKRRDRLDQELAR